MTGIQTGGIWILRHELLGQLSDIFSAHQGQAPCPCWESTVPRLGKQRAHFTYKNGLYGEAVKQVGGKHGVCQPAAILRRNYCQQQCCRLRTIKKQIVFL